VLRFGFAFHSWHMPHAQEECTTWAEASASQNLLNSLICIGMAGRKTFPRSTCQCGTASQMVGCQFPGTQKKCCYYARRDRARGYGFTCTLASLVTNWIGRCCESLAFTCTTDRVLFPGASALITMPVTVPVPLAPGVFG
jgi:hypothetical protein